MGNKIVLSNRFRIVAPKEGIKYQSNKEVHLHLVSDSHLGSTHFDEELFDKCVSIIQKDPNSVVILNGDMVEGIPPNGKIPQRGQVKENDAQVIELTSKLTPIRHKILAINSGNHSSSRFIKAAGVDLEMLIARCLGVPYYGTGGYVSITVGKYKYLLAISHGSSFAKDNDLELLRMRGVYSGADIYALGHTHSLFVKPVDQLYFNGQEHLKPVYLCRTGSFLKYADYAREKFLQIVRNGWLEIIFKRNGKIEFKLHTDR